MLLIIAQINALYEVTAVKIYLAKTVLCITLVTGHLNLTSGSNVHTTDFTWKMVVEFDVDCEILEID